MDHGVDEASAHEVARAKRAGGWFAVGVLLFALALGE
jgi:hypothetical protein